MGIIEDLTLDIHILILDLKVEQFIVKKRGDMDNSKKIILDLCGGTGAWSKPYKEAGYDVRVITLPDQNVITYLPPGNIYGILAAPPCAKFSKANWAVKKVNRDFKEGMICVRACMNIIWHIQENGAPLKFWALENPMGYLYNFMGKPAFYFQPWQFGDKSFLATKRTAIWGYFKEPVKTVRKRNVPYISDPKNTKYTNSNPGWQKDKKLRAITPEGFAQAFFKSNK